MQLVHELYPHPHMQPTQGPAQHYGGCAVGRDRAHIGAPLCTEPGAYLVLTVLSTHTSHIRRQHLFIPCPLLLLSTPPPSHACTMHHTAPLVSPSSLTLPTLVRSHPTTTPSTSPLNPTYPLNPVARDRQGHGARVRRALPPDGP